MCIFVKPSVVLLGANGFVGSALSRELQDSFDVVPQTRRDFDVCDQKLLSQFLEKHEAKIVINATGKVAGIRGNIENPASLLISNINSSIAIMNVCHNLKIRNLIQFASACVYPLNEKTSARPEDLNKGEVEPTSRSYAMAKLLVIEATRAFNEEHNYNWKVIIPSNLYGPGDWETDSGGHVMSMLMARFIVARRCADNKVEVWGDGKSRRSFLHISDLASAVNFLLTSGSFVEDVINVSGDFEHEISDIAALIKKITDFSGDIFYDLTKPNGARRKKLDDSYLRGFGWSPKISLAQGLLEYKNLFERVI